MRHASSDFQIALAVATTALLTGAALFSKFEAGKAKSAATRAKTASAKKAEEKPLFYGKFVKGEIIITDAADPDGYACYEPRRAF